jgi:hypothetical protein
MVIEIRISDVAFKGNLILVFGADELYQEPNSVLFPKDTANQEVEEVEEYRVEHFGNHYS